MDTLSNMKLNKVEIEDIEFEIPKCRFSINNKKINENDSYNMLLKIISEKVEVIDYDKKDNVAILDLTGFVCNNLDVLDNLFKIKCQDPEVEYLNIIVEMINGNEGKPYYDTFLQAYKEDKLVTSDADIIEMTKNEEEREY